jgi:hypothetical protein
VKVGVDILQTLSSISSIIAANTATKMIIGTSASRSVLDMYFVVYFVTVVVQCVATLSSRFMKSALV